MSKKKRQHTGLGKGLGAFFTDDLESLEEDSRQEEGAAEEKASPAQPAAEETPSPDTAATSPGAAAAPSPTADESSAPDEGAAVDQAVPAAASPSSPDAVSDEIQEIPLTDIRPNPYQPRLHFDEQALQELAHSIQEQGVLQPVILRQSQVKGYELIAGERRCRAAELAGLDTIPAIVRQMSDAQMIETSIIENLQREDLTPLEEAQAYKNMMESLDLTQAETARRLGKSRSHVANMVRLLDLNEDVKDMVQAGSLSMGQARTLLGVKNKKEQSRLAKQAAEEGLTVRQLEKMVQALNAPATPVADKPPKPQKPAYIRESEDRLMDKFGTAVKIKSKGDKGKIEIEYLSQDDLTRILDLLNIRFDD